LRGALLLLTSGPTLLMITIFPWSRYTEVSAHIIAVPSEVAVGARLERASRRGVAKDVAGLAVTPLAVADVIEVLLLSHDRVNVVLIPQEYSRAVWVPQAGLGALKPHGADEVVLDVLLRRGEGASAVFADSSHRCLRTRDGQG
jgi:hypothetical protein